MLDEKTVSQIQKNLQRIFSMKVTPSTFREVQNNIVTALDNKQNAEQLFQAFFTGEIPEGLSKGKAQQLLTDVIDQFAIPIRLSKDVLERGEFINVLTSDSLQNDKQVVFLNRIRRIDGDEFHFLTDPESTMQVLQHFTNRLHDFSKSERGHKLGDVFKAQFTEIQKKIDEIVK
jgi:hypothetical protein